MEFLLLGTSRAEAQRGKDCTRRRPIEFLLLGTVESDCRQRGCGSRQLTQESHHVATPASSFHAAWPARASRRHCAGEAGHTLRLPRRTKPAASPAKQRSKPLPPAEVHWLQDKRGCKFANPTPKPNESVTWSGACVGWLHAGQGRPAVHHRRQAGRTLRGNAHQGTVDRPRRAAHPPTTAVYDGDWVDSKPDGYGAYTAADGSKYEGAWTAGQFDGPGSFRSAKGEVVRGVWENGKLVKQLKD